MDTLEIRERLKVIETISLPDEAAITWLRENSFTDPPQWLSNIKSHQLISWAFSRRSSPRVRLAVARYGSHIKSLRRMFREGSRSERLGILTNTLVGPDMGGIFGGQTIIAKEDAVQILKKPISREFRALFKNPNINRDWLAGLLKDWEKSDGLTEDSLFWLVRNLSGNPVIGSKRDDTRMDGFDEYLYYRMNQELADLFQKVPTTDYWARTLADLLYALYLPFVPDFKVDLLERWKTPDVESNTGIDDYESLRQEIIQRLILRDHRPGKRAVLSLDHGDPAVRKGLYSSMSPLKLFPKVNFSSGFSYPGRLYPDKTRLSEDQSSVLAVCESCFERDKNEFIECLLRNESFWNTRHHRDLLREICWSLADDPNHDMDMPNMYRSIERHHQERHPNWFDDEDEPLSPPTAEEPPDPLLQYLSTGIGKLREEVATLRSDMGSLSQSSYQHVLGLLSELMRGIRSLQIVAWILVFLAIYLAFS